MSKNIKENTKAVWGAAPAGWTFGGGLEPGTKEFFENVLRKRSSYEQPWLFELVPFVLFEGKKVLELGCGAGYDAYEFCRNGADYTGIDITPENIYRTKKHLGYYGYYPKVMMGDAENLQFKDESFDVVFSNGVLHHTPDIEKSFKEAHRVLKPGGEFFVIVYHKNSVFYWFNLFICQHILERGFLKRRFKERLSMIEYTTSNALPIVNVYSRKDIKKLLEHTGFTVNNLWIRKLVKEDIRIISLPVLSSLLLRLRDAIPQQWLDFIGKRFGWYVIAMARR